MSTDSPRRERKVVTVVFCDLVGFTSQAETMDPEDVEALLHPYHSRVRAELERRGGTVEKFIGDAVMALFGAPIAHEDDPERAVRAALAIRDWAAETDEIQVRVAVTTGEALIRLDAHPGAGEGMASGDVVNTAARLQTAAPVNGILVDETTFRATRHAIEHDEVAAVEAKGKVEPIPVWRPRVARSRFGVDVAHEARAELVGRDRELGVLRDAFSRASQERIPQLVTLVGVPGIGKSRLVYELSRIADALPEIITWRQGRCLAYGDGVTLWALGEIVKAQAGIVEQDSPDVVRLKVAEVVENAFAGSDDAEWVESHVLALVGLAEESELGGDRRGEAFAAWRRLVEGLAEQRPLVLVFEDLHWADETLLDFVDELVDWVTDVPLLVVGTARPELLERRPGWAGGKLNATTLALAPLSDEQTANLIGQLLERPVLAVESQQALLERAGGNPLYAEQFADLFRERGSAEELPLPETLQGIIAARLDGLPQEEKELLLDASVVGKVFWSSALRLSPEQREAGLHALERKGFVRRQKRSSVAGESEFAFAHALVRDVAYRQLPRPDRAEKHRRVAEWIESLGRPGDHAEMLAHHWVSALDLALAARKDGGDLADHTRLALRKAGDRAFGLNAFASASGYYERALTLWPDAAPERPQLLFRRAHALHIAADERAEQALTEARDALLDSGDLEAGAEAEALLAHSLWYRGQRNEAYAHLAHAEELAVGQEKSRAKARILCLVARFRMLAGEHSEAERLGRDALALAEELQLDELRAHALATMGSARELSGRGDGLADIETAFEIAVAARSPYASSILNNLAVARWISGDLVRGDELYREAERIAEQFGDGAGLRWSRGNQIVAHYERGRWDDALQAAENFIRECESSPHYLEHFAREIRAQIRLSRGDAAVAVEDWERGIEQAREAKDPQAILPSLLRYAWGCAWLGRLDDARSLAAEALDVIEQQPQFAVLLGILLGPFPEELGVADRGRELLAIGPRESRWKEAARAIFDGDYARAADVYERMDAVTAEAEMRLANAARLIEAGRYPEGAPDLQKALAFHRSVGATFFVRHAEQLLPASA
jgi:class 3 adenylate cyclase/tetratricopeptide (TPR) repeat protein